MENKQARLTEEDNGKQTLRYDRGAEFGFWGKRKKNKNKKKNSEMWPAGVGSLDSHLSTVVPQITSFRIAFN